MPLEIIPFGEDDLDAAANLVAARYTAAAHADNALLPERYTDPDAILPRLQRMFEGAPGVAAISDGRLAGFLLAHLFSNRGERMAYVPDLGHAADEEGASTIYRAMYAELARTWLSWGASCHAITCYPHEQEGMDAWFSLGFGMLVIDALRDLEPPPPTAAGVEVRRATSRICSAVTAGAIIPCSV